MGSANRILNGSDDGSSREATLLGLASGDANIKAALSTTLISSLTRAFYTGQCRSFITLAVDIDGGCNIDIIGSERETRGEERRAGGRPAAKLTGRSKGGQHAAEKQEGKDNLHFHYRLIENDAFRVVDDWG